MVLMIFTSSTLFSAQLPSPSGSTSGSTTNLADSPQLLQQVRHKLSFTLLQNTIMTDREKTLYHYFANYGNHKHVTP